jgi:hypothetical protein
VPGSGWCPTRSPAGTSGSCRAKPCGEGGRLGGRPRRGRGVGLAAVDVARELGARVSTDQRFYFNGTQNISHLVPAPSCGPSRLARVRRPAGLDDARPRRGYAGRCCRHRRVGRLIDDKFPDPVDGAGAGDGKDCGSERYSSGEGTGNGLELKMIQNRTAASAVTAGERS